MSKRYTVQQLADLSGVSVRTLHHYDRIGLLVPAFLGDNGYRYYRSPELLRLQQILLFREFDIPLASIRMLLALPVAGQLDELRRQRAALLAEAERYRLLAESIDRPGIRTRPRLFTANDVDRTRVRSRSRPAGAAGYGWVRVRMSDQAPAVALPLLL